MCYGFDNTLVSLAGSIFDACWARVSKLISFEALLRLLVIWMTPPVAAVVAPFWDVSFVSCEQMFVGGGPSGDCPSLERRRERRGAA